MRLVGALDRRRRVTAVPSQRPGAPEAHGLTPADCERAVWAVTSDGRRYPAAAAVNVVLAAALGTSLPWRVYRLPGVRSLEDRAYAWVARHRHRLPGVEPYCARYPEECLADATPRTIIERV